MLPTWWDEGPVPVLAFAWVAELKALAKAWLEDSEG
jgi:hypothetical protein